MKLSYKLYCLYSYYNQTTTQRQLYDFYINIYIYMCVCGTLVFTTKSLQYPTYNW